MTEEFARGAASSAHTARVKEIVADKPRTDEQIAAHIAVAMMMATYVVEVYERTLQ